MVAAITAYNYPLIFTAFKVGAALASGCTVVLLPSPRTLTAAMLFMECVEESGIPPGVVNMVTGEAEVGRALSGQQVDLVSFTGSVSVGKSIVRQVADELAKVVLELGGKSPNIILPGVDIAEVVGPTLLRCMRNTGQGCGNTTRILVPRREYDQFVDHARSYLAGLTIGDPFLETTELGPLISAEHRATVEGYAERAVTRDGAQILARGPALAREPGFFMTPLLLGGVENSSELCQEELFGPVAALLPFDDVEGAVAIANETRFGINANIWGPVDVAEDVGLRLKAGTVTINGGGGDRPDAPWPTMGQSGVGVDRGRDGFQEYFRVRHIQTPLASTETS